MFNVLIIIDNIIDLIVSLATFYDSLWLSLILSDKEVAKKL